MDNHGKIIAALFIAFFVFVTLRGELPRYIAVIVGPSVKDSVPAPTAKKPGFFESLLGGGIFGGLFGGDPSPSDSSPQGTSSSTITFGSV